MCIANEKHRVSFLTVSQTFDLNLACVPLRGLGWGTFHVGSSLVRPDYHDVDLRCMLPESDFYAMFPGGNNSGHLKFLNTAVSEWIAARTGLPIDFQFQRATEANERFPATEHRRNGVGH